MSRFIESIKYSGKAYNLPFHQERVNRTFRHFYNRQPHQLESILAQNSPPDDDLYKIRLVYDEIGYEVSIIPYTQKRISRLTLVHANIDYGYKYEDRNELEALKSSLASDDEILIVKDNLLTDSSYSNIVLMKDHRWYTPDSPLLEGTQREYLLSHNKIWKAEIPMYSLGEYQKIGLINAMIGLGDLVLDINSIVVK